MEVLVRRFHQIKIIMMMVFFRICGSFILTKPWVLIERGDDARDNAYFFYRYLKKNHPEQKVYYIIDKNSPDYYKVKENAVHFGSIKNYWAVAIADKIISSHGYTGMPNMTRKLFHFLRMHEKYYFLQHGVIKDDLPSLHYDQMGVRLFICGAKPEYEYVREEFGYPPGSVQYTGLARYDTLHDVKTKNQILIMPTWRMYITDEKNFLESEYYRQWNRVLTDSGLAEYLEKNDLSAIFYPHYEVQKYLRCFRTASDRIILADFANYDVQTLLKESKLLVTDYSSVFFDFAYMRKPVVYFQFDQHEFFSRHYGRGYFSYQTMGFGPVTEHVETTVEAIIQSAEYGFLSTDTYRKRMEAFFPLYDQKNCERIYDAVCSL